MASGAKIPSDQFVEPQPHKRRAIMLVGPSSVGKSDIAIALSRLVDGEIINADKYYLYSGFSSTTGLPDFENHPDVVTHLYGIQSPDKACPSDREFGSLVSKTVEEIIRRGRIPIVEGCYYRFSHAILTNSKTLEWFVAGIKWSADTDVRALVTNRVNSIFHARGGIEEVRQAIRAGYRRTYVMREGSMVRPLVEFLDGQITLEEAKEKAIAEILASAYKALRKFLDLPNVTWWEHDGTKIERISREIAMHLDVNACCR